MDTLGFGECEGFIFIEGCFTLLMRRKFANLGANLGWHWIEERALDMLEAGG